MGPVIILFIRMLGKFEMVPTKLSQRAWHTLTWNMGRQYHSFVLIGTCTGRELCVWSGNLWRKVSCTFLVLSSSWTAVAMSESLENVSPITSKPHGTRNSLFVLNKDSYNLGFIKICFHLLRSVHLCRTMKPDEKNQG